MLYFRFLIGHQVGGFSQIFSKSNRLYFKKSPPELWCSATMKAAVGDLLQGSWPQKLGVVGGGG